MSTVLLVALGTAGDVYPIVGIGLALRERGHRVRVLTHGYYEALVRGAGLDYAEIATTEEFLEISRDPQLDKLSVAIRRLGELAVIPAIPRVYRIIESECAKDETVVVGSAVSLGAKFAHERLGVPIVNAHVHTFYLRSAYDTSVLPVPLPPVVRRGIYGAMDIVIDRLWNQPVGAFRAELGLPSVRASAALWQPCGRDLGLFPEWFAPRRPDWPRNLAATGFPLYDGADSTPVPETVRRFVESGDPPIVFATASWMRHGRDFFEASARACERLGRRGLLLTRFPEQIPESLPSGVESADFVPYAWMFARSAALVHHGGIGNVAFALAAGIPHVVSPLNVDQPYNASLLQKLGVSVTIPPRSYRPARLVKRLGALLDSSQVKRRCEEVAQRFAETSGEPARQRACEIIEESFASGPPPRYRGVVVI